MCEFCTKHGDGEIWYKNAKNYSDDLMSDLKRRQYINEFLETTMGNGITTIGRLETIFRKRKKLPPPIVKTMVDKAREEHFGQVVPIEDIQEIVNKAEIVVRMPCACRWAAEKNEKRCCYAVSYTPSTWFDGLDQGYFGKPGDEGLESFAASEAISQMRNLEDEGAIHTIWTMITPFIGAICNCSRQECLGLRALAMDVLTLSPAEYTAQVDQSRCDGCGLCEDSCQFGAISSIYISGETFAQINRAKCFGCGLCRKICPQNALTLK